MAVNHTLTHTIDCFSDTEGHLISLKIDALDFAGVNVIIKSWIQ